MEWNSKPAEGTLENFTNVRNIKEGSRPLVGTCQGGKRDLLTNKEERNITE